MSVTSRVLDHGIVDPSAQFWARTSSGAEKSYHQSFMPTANTGRATTALSSSSHARSGMLGEVPLGVATAIFASGLLCGVATHRVGVWYLAARHLIALRRLRAPHRTLAPSGFYSGPPCGSAVCVMERMGYTIGYSNYHRCALWSVFVVSASGVRHAAQVPRSMSFFTDVSVPKSSRWSAGSMRVAGYDRGHLAPPASVGTCRQSSDETSLVSNIALQHPRLNRQTWKALEGAVRRYVVSHAPRHSSTNSELAVTVGPVFTSSRKRNSGGTVNPASDTTPRIADAFFMAVYEPTTGHTAAFVAKNNASAACDRLSLTALERLLTESQNKQREDAEPLPSASSNAATWSSRMTSLLWRAAGSNGTPPPLWTVTLFPRYRAVGDHDQQQQGGGMLQRALRRLLPWRDRGIPSAQLIREPSSVSLILCKKKNAPLCAPHRHRHTHGQPVKGVA